MKVSFGQVSSTVMRKKENKKIHCSKRQLEEVATNLERVVKAQPTKELSYEELLEQIATELERARAKCQTRRKYQRKPKV